MLKMSKEIIRKKLADKLEDREGRIKHLQQVADTFQIKISIDREASFRALILYLFPCMNLTHNLPYRANGIESAIERIYMVANNPEFYALQSTNITSINRKKKQIKLFRRNMFEFNNWKFFGLSGEVEEVQAFNNGYSWIQFADPKDWDKFMKVYDYTNEDTERIIEALTEAEKIKFKNRTKENKFLAATEIIREKNLLPLRFANIRLIIDFLES